MNKSQALLKLNEQHGANNYHPLPIVIEHAQGVWVEDVEGKRYLDMLAAYSACLLYTSPSPRDRQKSRMPSSA